MLSPLSGNNNVTKLNVLSPQEIAQCWITQLGVDVGSEFKKLSEIEYWRCNDTNLHWYLPKEAAGSGELYSQLEKFDWYYMPDKWEFQAAVDLLNQEDSVLEVGVGFGYFLEVCRMRGIEITGVELNSTAAERARNKGFEIFEDDLHSLADRMGKVKFDTICSFQVLEHVSEPGSFFEGMLSNLKTGGRLILSVPNAAVMRRIDPNNENLLNQPPHHISHWDIGVFRSLEGFLPVKVRSVHHEPMASYHINWIISSYLRNQFSFLGRTATKVLFNHVTLYPIYLVARLGLRKLLPGHTLLVELEKVG